MRLILRPSFEMRRWVLRCDFVIELLGPDVTVHLLGVVVSSFAELEAEPSDEACIPVKNYDFRVYI